MERTTSAPAENRIQTTVKSGAGGIGRVRASCVQAALLASVLFALSPHVVSYAGACKRFASDSALAFGLFAVAHGSLEGKGGVEHWVPAVRCGVPRTSENSTRARLIPCPSAVMVNCAPFANRGVGYVVSRT